MTETTVDYTDIKTTEIKVTEEDWRDKLGLTEEEADALLKKIVEYMTENQHALLQAVLFGGQVQDAGF